MDKNAENLQIVRKSVEGSNKRFLLRLNRLKNQLEVYEKVSNEVLYRYHSIRKDFDSSNYAMFEKIKSISCICGGENTPTPYGIFNVEQVSKKCYVSYYHKKYDQVKFFGYIVIFEDYFIHSNMYLMDVEESQIRKGKANCISVDDTFTSGCIRIEQKELDWLLDTIECGTIVQLM